MLSRSDTSLRVVLATTLLILWECVASVVRDARLAPHVWELLTISFPGFAIFDGASSANYMTATTLLAHSAVKTLLRALGGLVLGGVVGVLTGLAGHFFRSQSGSHKLLLSLIRSAPLFSLLPLWLYWFSGNQVGIISYVAFAVFVFVATGCYEAVLEVPQFIVWQARLLGANRLQVFRSIMLPAMLPHLVKTLRWVLGLLMAFSLGAEYLSSESSGLGSLVYRCYLYSNVGQLLILAGLYALLGGLLIRMFDCCMRVKLIKDLTQYEA